MNKNDFKNKYREKPLNFQSKQDNFKFELFFRLK